MAFAHSIGQDFYNNLLNYTNKNTTNDNNNFSYCNLYSILNL